jgi:predicted MFS family arabinose efflux permease
VAWSPPPAFRSDTYPAVSLPRPSTLQRNLALDLSSAVGLGTTMAIVTVLLPSVARREGLDTMGLAALAALPFLARLLTLFAGRIGPRSPARLGVLRAVGALGLLLVLIAPHPLLIAAATFGFWISFALGAPLQQRIWATIYPSPDRGRLLGYVGTGRFAAGTVALLTITVAATTSGWVPIVAVVAGVGAISSLAVTRMSVPGVESGQTHSAKGSIRSVMSTPMIRRIATAQLLFGAGLMAAPAFIAMVHVDRLGLTISDIALAGLLGYGSTAATIGLWGRFAGRVGALRTISAGTVLGTIALSVFAFAPDFPTVIAATLLLGTSLAALNASWPLLIADHAGAGDQASVAAGLNSIMGLRGLITPFLVMAPVQAGLIDETGGLVICLMLASTGALLYGRIAGLVRLPDGTVERVRTFEQQAAMVAQRKPAISSSPLSSIGGWPVNVRNRLIRSTMAGWVLNRPRALLSSFLTGLTT